MNEFVSLFVLLVVMWVNTRTSQVTDKHRKESELWMSMLWVFKIFVKLSAFRYADHAIPILSCRWFMEKVRLYRWLAIATQGETPLLTVGLSIPITVPILAYTTIYSRGFIHNQVMFPDIPYTWNIMYPYSTSTS